MDVVSILFGAPQPSTQIGPPAWSGVIFTLGGFHLALQPESKTTKLFQFYFEAIHWEMVQ